MHDTTQSYEERELARLEQMMRDPRYWKNQDPAIVEAVREGFRALYGGGDEAARAEAGRAANVAGVNGPDHMMDSRIVHVTPGEIVIPLSAQTPELRRMLVQLLGNDLPRYTVGSGFERRNPVSDLPAFADPSFWDEIFRKATEWHFEGRDALNQPLPSSEEGARQGGFWQTPQWQAQEHQNEIGNPEKKYVHPSGREVVFDGDTGKVVDDPAKRGTYNYINMWDSRREMTPLDLPEWVLRFLSHGAVDYLPYKIGGNVRGEG